MPITGTSIIIWGPHLLFCMSVGTNCALLISVVIGGAELDQSFMSLATASPGSHLAGAVLGFCHCFDKGFAGRGMVVPASKDCLPACHAPHCPMGETCHSR
jgi:hypothetical protein